jgi:CubicO group peptidase (beta-lactamase class C family)
MPRAPYRTRARRLGLALLCLAAPTATTPTGAHAQHAPLAGLDSYIEHAMRAWGVPGLAIAIVKDDSVVLAKGYGVRELGKPEPVDAHTLFAIGSNTKAFTAAAIGILVDEGKMRWDDPVTAYLPWFQLYDPYVTREITIRDLLSHRSGLGRQGDLLWYGSAYGRDEILRRVRYLHPTSSFRSQYGYQNIMYLAAGQALGAAAGRTWDEVIAERLFRPLGMTESNTSVTALQGETDVATPHLITDGTARPIPWRNIDNIAPAGSINSSVADMARWIRLQLANGGFEGKQIIRAQTIAELRRPEIAIPSPADTLFPSTHFTLYGMGWVLQDYRGRELVWHNGGIDGMLSEVRLVPEAKLGIVILSNAEGHNMNPAIAYRIIDAYLGGPVRDWSAIFLARYRAALARQQAAEQAVVAARRPDTRPSLPLEQYAGTYADTLYGNATVTLEQGRLVLRYGPAFTGDLTHWHYDTFRVTWRHPRLGSSFVTFTLDARGKVADMDVQDITRFHAVPDTTATAAGRSR